MSSDAARAVPLTCHGHSRPVTHLSFSDTVADGSCYILSACKDNNPMLRDGATGDWIGTFLGHKGASWQARLSSDGSLAATASADFTAKIWNSHTGECLRTIQHPHIVRAVAFPHGLRPKRIATGSFDKKLRVFELGDLLEGDDESLQNGHGHTESTASQHAEIEIGAGVHGGSIKSVLWTRDNKTIITGCEDKYIRWFDVETRKTITAIELSGPLGTCEMSNTLSVVAVAAGKDAYFFSGMRPGHLLKKIEQPNEIVSLALNEQEQKYVAAGGGSDTWIRVWAWDQPAEAGKELDIWKGHHGPIWSLAFSPDNSICASGSEDGTVKLWKFCQGSYGLWQ